MLTEQEEAFILFWEEKRMQQKKNLKQFLKGLSSGLIIGTAIILLLVTGWYQRANMEANSKLSPVILFLTIAILSVFMGFLYQNYRWEMNEQQWLELLSKKKKLKGKKPEDSEQPLIWVKTANIEQFSVKYHCHSPIFAHSKNYHKSLLVCNWKV